jgi:hypothetical protein
MHQDSLQGMVSDYLLLLTLVAVIGYLWSY